MAGLYHLTLDALIDFDPDVAEIEQVIERTSEQTQKKIDWTKLWGKKYPVLTTYPELSRWRTTPFGSGSCWTA